VALASLVNRSVTALAAETLPRLLERCQDLIEDVDFAFVAAWKEAHPEGKVVGSFPVYTPWELLHAAGVFPVGLMGAGDRLEIDHADSRIQSFVCSIARSTLELGLTGRLDAFDGMVFSDICDVARNLSGVWQRNFPGAFVAYLHYPHNVDSPAAASFLRGEFERLRAGIEELTGRPVDRETLRESMGVFNEGRRLLRAMYAIRRETPWLLPAADAYLLLRAGCYVPKEDHVRMLRTALAAVRKGGGKEMDRVRVVVEGSFCEQPPVELLRVVEEAGCYVVDDDLLVGHRWFAKDIPTDGDPLGALARAYVDSSVVSSVRHPGRTPRPEALIRKVREGRADGVIFCSAKFCEPALYDYVPFKEVLEKAGIPYLSIEFEEKMSTFETVRTQVETFVESILFD
jgi:benzoyl-CoA reductase subunit C